MSEFSYIWMEEKYAQQKKQESSRWALMYGIELYRRDFPFIYYLILCSIIVQVKYICSESLYLKNLLQMN
jgi:hypothetical protein